MRAAKGLVVALMVAAACTLAIAAARSWVPAQSAGVVYLAGVLFVSSRYGLVAGLGTSVVSILAFNFFFLPPLHTLVIRDSGDWLTLALFAVAAVVTSQLAARARDEAAEARRRAQEAELGLQFTTLLARGDDLARALPELARLAARSLGGHDGTITTGQDDGHTAGGLPLMLDGTRIGTLVVSPAPAHLDPQVAARVATVLAGLVALGGERDRLIADRVEAESLRRSDQAKTALLRAVSHDLRSPLMAISAAAGALRLSATEAVDRELADTVLGETERLNRLVGDLLDLSRLQAGGMAVQADWCDVADIVRAAVREVDRNGAARITVDLPRQLPLVRADARQLERVLVNLMENAAAYTPAGKEVEVQARAVDSAVRVEVLDRGPGVPATERQRIFEPFYRGSAVPKPAGSGLGLAIVRGLAEANHASVTVDDRNGGGAAFTLTLPTGAAA